MKGFYLNGFNTQKVVTKIKEELLSADNKKEFETKQYTEFSHQFQLFLALALLFLILDVLVLEKKTNWIKRLNLFNENKK